MRVPQAEDRNRMTAPVDNDRALDLALAYTPAPRRVGLAAAIELDREMSTIGYRAHEPLARQIRLAWWRDELTRLAQRLAQQDRNSSMPPSAPSRSPSPILKAIAEAHGAAGVSDDAIERLADLVDQWEVFWTDDGLDIVGLQRFAVVRARALAEYAAPSRTKEPSNHEDRDALLQAALAWAQADTAVRVTDQALKADFVEACLGSIGDIPPILPPWAKGVAVLGVLGRRALKRGGARLMEGRLSALVALRAGLLGR